MWAPAGAVYIIPAAALFVAWMRDMERGMAWEEDDRAEVATPSQASPLALPERAQA